MKTEITDILGVKYPILQGPMAFISDHRLVGAVCKSGAAGILASYGKTFEWVEDQILKIKQATSLPFGVNVPIGKHEDAMVVNRMLDLLIDMEVKFVTLGSGDPIPFMNRLLKGGVKVGCIVPNTRLAQKVSIHGADFLILEGTEAGGRVGKQTTMALMENVIPKMNLPIVVAGGIVDGRGLAAAMLMGAAGVQMGTRFLLAEECPVHDDYKRAIIQASDEDSVCISFGPGHSMRGLMNPYTNKISTRPSSSGCGQHANGYSGETSRRVVEEGLSENADNGFYLCGQSLMPLTKIQPVAQIIYEIISSASDALGGAAAMI